MPRVRAGNEEPRSMSQEPTTTNEELGLPRVCAGSPSRVCQAIWPWRERDAEGPVAAQAGVGKRSALESGVTLCIGLILFFVFHKRVLGGVVLCVGLGVLISGQVCPPAYRAFRKFWAVVARAVGTGLTWVLLVPFFYICFTGGRLFLLVMRKDPMHRAFPTKEPTYWVKHRPLDVPDHYLRQY